jgi:hypothetical protein
MNRPRRLSRALAATALAASALLAGCGGDEEPSSDEPGDESSEAQEAKEPALSPLTGLEVKGKGPDHPIMVTKVDNTSSAAPQAGLGSADMVVEELVEGGTTRLAVFHWSSVPDKVGPVRSMRASDIGIVSPAEATVVTSGAAPVTIKRVQDAGIPFFGEGSRGVYRDDARSAPYNLFVDLAELVKATKGPRKADPYFDFGTSKDLPKGKPATRVSADFGGRVSEWSYAKGGYTNTNSYAGEGDRFVPETLLALRVQIGDAGYADPGGNFVPETKFEGTGQALLFHGGRVVTGTWQKKGLEGHLTLKAGGRELTVPAGKTWIELVPAGDGGVSYGR